MFRECGISHVVFVNSSDSYQARAVSFLRFAVVSMHCATVNDLKVCVSALLQGSFCRDFEALSSSEVLQRR